MSLEQWEAFFPADAVKDEGPNMTEEEFLESEYLKKLRLRALPEIEF